MSARGELLEMLRQRYREAERSEKSRILDEFVSVTGYHRKHAIRLLRGSGSTEARDGRPRNVRYGDEVQDALVVFWEASDRITRTQVEHWFDGYSRSAPGGANRAIDLLRQILNFGIACGHLETNPTRGVRRNPQTPMTRFLSRNEIRRLHDALDATSRLGPGQRRQADVIRLLMMTGCRKGEIVNLRWSEADGDALVLADSKTGPRKVPLNPQARAILDRQPRGESPWVFPSDRRPDRPCSDSVRLWHRVRREAGIEDVRLHDLRHNYASHAVMDGVPVPVVSRLPGHSSTRMTLRYVHMDDRDVRAAAERIGHLTRIEHICLALPAFSQAAPEAQPDAE